MNTNVEYDASVLLILIGYGNVHNYVRMYPATHPSSECQQCSDVSSEKLVINFVLLRSRWHQQLSRRMWWSLGLALFTDLLDLVSHCPVGYTIVDISTAQQSAVCQQPSRKQVEWRLGARTTVDIVDL